MKSSNAPTTWLRVEPSPSTASEPFEAPPLLDRPRGEPARAGKWLPIIVGIAVLLSFVAGGVYWTGHRTPAPPPAEAAQAAAPEIKPAEPVPAPSPPAPITAAAAPAAAAPPAGSTPAAAPATPEPAALASPHLVFGTGPIIGEPAPPAQETEEPPPPATEQAPAPVRPASPTRKVHAHRAPAPPPASTAGPPTGIRF